MEDVQCQPEATRLALVWTVPAGDVDTCLVVAEQLAAAGAAQLVFRANTSGGALLLARLAPAASYRLSLSVLGRNGLWSRVVSLVCATTPEGRRLWPPPPGSTPQPPPQPCPRRHYPTGLMAVRPAQPRHCPPSRAALLSAPHSPSAPSLAPPGAGRSPPAGARDGDGRADCPGHVRRGGRADPVVRRHRHHQYVA